MSDKLTDKDIQKIAEAVVKEEHEQGFHVEPEQHYNDHEQLRRLLDAYESASSIIIKFFLGVFLVGVVAAIAIGSGWIPK